MSATAQWMRDRENRIACSRSAGNIHLDEVELAVEVLRGKSIHCVHDDKELGTIRTVSNRGDVIVLWADEYSESKNAIGLQPAFGGKGGKAIGMQSWLSPSDLKDYVLDKSKQCIT